MKVRELLLTALFAALTAVGAFIRVDIPFVPFTLQFFFCAFAGILLGSRLGALSQIVYVVIGLIGIPVFTKGGGISYIFQPTFGYLLGFIVCAWVIGRISESIKKQNFISILLSVVSGLLVLYLIGVPYLYFIYRFFLNSPKSVIWVITYGFGLFIGGDIVLSIIVSLIVYRVRPILRRAGLI